jgi:hypothetical protein
MSDMQKWLKLMESVHPVVADAPAPRIFERDATVVLGANVGGGVGRFVEFTTEGKARIDVKGVVREFAEGDFALPERDIENGNDWFHMSVIPGTPGTQNDKPEFRPGDMVKIADVYGTVIGPGFGVFVGYGTTGQDCIVLFDGKQIVVPIENVASVLEQDAKDNFGEMDNDGNLSPMSFGSDNVVKIVQEPAMDQKDEFTKWMEAVEEALKAEGQEVVEDVPPMTNECGCGSWDCPVCFPDQNEMPGMHGALDGLGGANVAVDPMSMAAPMDPMAQMGGMPQVCASCGGALDDGHMHEPNVVMGGVETGLEEVDPMDDMGADEMMQAPMEEEPMEVPGESLPRSSDGRGVKLGDIVQHTEYRKVGQDSPLTYGDENLDEVTDEFDTTEPDWDADPMAVRDYHNTMAGAPQSEADVESALDMIATIKYMQQMGLSKASRDFSEEEMANMGLPQLKQVHQEVTGTMAEERTMNMENVDPDVAAMLKTLQGYDKMVAEGKRKPDFKDVDKDGNKKEPWVKAEKDKKEVKESDDDKNPWEKKADDKKDDKVTKTHKGGTVTKTDTGLVHKSAKYGNQKDEVKESAEVDPEVLEWMARLAKVAR